MFHIDETSPDKSKPKLSDLCVISRYRAGESEKHCYYVYGGEFLLASNADVCLRKTMYPYAGKTQKEKSKKFESDALILITWKLFWHKSHSER